MADPQQPQTGHKPDPTIYTVGGTVQTNEQGLYLPRPADEELLTLCRQSDFAYVLTPRQMGKSSLMIRTAEALLEEGRQAVIIDLTQIGTQVSVDEWYRGLLTVIADQLELRVRVSDWWQSHSDLGVTQRLTQFFQEVVMTEVQDPVVIFVDEIDTTLSLDFTDDFFAAIRFLYVARATQPDLRRLSFVLIGVATPGDLIRDPKRTPFNIGQRVDLTDFTADEALPLMAGLGLSTNQTQAVLGWVLKWTGGHPYLTQRLCQAIAQVGGENWSEAEVDRLVVRTFLGIMSEQDNNLQFVRDMLTKRAPEDVGAVAVLKTYREIRRGKRPVLDEEQSLVKSHLKLSGIVHRQGRCLQIRNLIYRQVFDWAWIKTHLPETLWQRLKPALPIIATLLIAFVGMLGVAVYAIQQRGYAVEQQLIAEDALQQVEDALQQARDERQRAEVALRQIENALNQARIAQQNAREQEERANQEAKEADQQRDKANQEAKNARDQARLATEQRGRAEVQTQIAFSRQLAAQAQALQSDDPRLIHNSTLLAVEAMRRLQSSGMRSLQADQVLRHGISLLPHPVARISSEATEGSPFSSIYPATVFSPDNKYLYTATSDVLKISETTSGRNVRQIDYSSKLKAFAFSSDGQYFALADENNIKILELPSLREVRSLSHDERVKNVFLSRKGEYLIIENEDSCGQIFNLPDNQVISLTDLPCLWSGLNIIVSPDEDHLSVRSFGSRILRSWNLANGYEINVSEISEEPLLQDGPSSFKFFEADRIVTGHQANSSLQVWEVPGGRKVAEIPETGQWISEWNLSKNGKYLATGDRSGNVIIWDLLNGELVTRIQVGSDWISGIVFSPNNNYLITSQSRDDMLRIWEVPTGREIGRIFKDEYIRSEDITFSPDSHHLAIQEISSDPYQGEIQEFVVSLWDSIEAPEVGSRNYEYVEDLEPNSNETRKIVTAIDLSMNGKYMVVAERGRIHLIHIADGKEVLNFTHEGVEEVTFSSSGKYLASTSADGTIHVWNIADNYQPIHTFNHREESSAEGISFSSDEKYLISSSSYTSIVWDLSNSKETRRLNRAEEEDGYSIITLDGKYIIRVKFGSVSDGEGYVWIQDILSNRESVHIQLPDDIFGPATGFTLSPDGKYLAATSFWVPADSAFTRDGRAYVWEVNSGRQIMRLEEPIAILQAVFDPGNKYLATVVGEPYSDNKLIKVWELTTGEEVIRIQQEGDIDKVILSSNGKYLATNRNFYTGDSTKSVVQIWLQRPEDLIELACNRLTRNFTREEWEQYFENEPYRRTCPNLPEPEN
ncbi:AAA-like domain-containing protein [Leptolyngbya sp. FACHB-541]|uniref:AAA-like domain-containing protein n=1 Tax=Leptolyngbya sp. FACHB-541 TaxID=2692810 RepID=UPI0016868213|nr:AAA-like domain-containing protein [Leptolyngbya sp. FACHB-541]MBD1996136.1 AAA-like domain-containing protein [Leptolyngbya sp. FACHB-541]